MSAFLELPELGRVPRTQTVYGESPLSATVALALLDSPFGAHAAQAATMAPADVIASVLSGWLHTFAQPPRAQEPSETLADVFRRGPFRFRVEYSETDETGIELALHAARDHSAHYYVANRLKQAEQLRAGAHGLGQTALVALAWASDSSVPILLPATLLYMAGNRKYLLNAFESYPRWVLDPQPLDRATIQGLANPRRTRFTGRLARAILALEDAVAAAKKLDLPPRRITTAWPLEVGWESAHDWGAAYRRVTDDWGQRHGRDKTAIFVLREHKGPKLAPALHRFMTSIAGAAPVLQAAAAVVRELSGDKRDEDE